jgi:hypothetical protein
LFLSIEYPTESIIAQVSPEHSEKATIFIYFFGEDLDQEYAVFHEKRSFAQDDPLPPRTMHRVASVAA